MDDVLQGVTVTHRVPLVHRESVCLGLPTLHHAHLSALRSEDLGERSPLFIIVHRSQDPPLLIMV